jgi:hypothetical protein
LATQGEPKDTMNPIRRFRVWRARRALKRMSLTMCGQTMNGEEMLLLLAPALSRPEGASKRELFSIASQHLAKKALAGAAGEVSK